MLMAELSRSSGVPVATIKDYLREGLLPPGTATSATRAEYGEDRDEPPGEPATRPKPRPRLLEADTDERDGGGY